MSIPMRYSAWDKVTLTLEQQDKVYGWWKQQDINTVENCPFEKGIIVCKNAVQTPKGFFDGYLTFELKTEFIQLEEIYATDGRVVRKWELLYEGELIEGVPNFNISYSRGDQANKQRMLDLTTIFLSIVNFIAYYREVKELISEHSVSTKKVKKDKSGKPKSNVRYVPSKVYSIQSIPTSEDLKRERHTEAWAVRGHPRHYKSGKVVWIKPYVKGDKDKIEPKEYRVSDFSSQEDQT
jgi:hypothetical protein